MGRQAYSLLAGLTPALRFRLRALQQDLDFWDVDPTGEFPVGTRQSRNLAPELSRDRCELFEEWFLRSPENEIEEQYFQAARWRQAGRPLRGGHDAVASDPRQALSAEAKNDVPIDL